MSVEMKYYEIDKKLEKGTILTYRCCIPVLHSTGQKLLHEGLIAYHLSSEKEARQLIDVIKNYQKGEGIGGYSYRIRARGPRAVHCFGAYKREYDQDLPLAFGVTFSVYRNSNYEYFKRRGITNLWRYWNDLKATTV